jgi:hypothetical protein
MRTLGALFFIALALGASAEDAQAESVQQSHQRSCKPRPARLYLASPVARIWFVPRGVRSGFYACYGRRTRRVFLGDEFEGAGVTHVDLVGRFVA